MNSIYNVQRLLAKTTRNSQRIRQYGIETSRTNHVGYCYFHSGRMSWCNRMFHFSFSSIRLVAYSLLDIARCILDTIAPWTSAFPSFEYGVDGDFLFDFCICGESVGC